MKNRERDMKKFLMYGLLLAGAALTSCQYTEMIDPNPEPVNQNRETRMQIAIDDMSGGIPLFEGNTRATVPEVAGEKNVTDLQLLFFNYRSDGSGTFAGKYDVPNEYLTGDYVNGTPFDLNIGSGTEGGADLSHMERYTILAYANMADLPDMSGKTEVQAREEIRSVNYAAKFISGSVLSLPMSGTTVKEPEQELVTLKLTRMVARLDVKNELSGYTLKSVSILNAATRSRIWSSQSGLESVGTQTHTGEAYGMTETEITAQGNGGNIFGGLYVFGNFVGNPLLLSERPRTTALLVELQKGGDPIEFHRVDIHPLDEGQNLKKNHVYQATLKGIISKGGTKQEAIDSRESTLDVVINNWSPEADEGLILNDGTNMLVSPTRYIKFGPEAEIREYLIYTSGTGTLEITARSLPNGITATIEGNTLIVEAAALSDQEERSGTLELGFAGLRGLIQVVQSPDDNLYLNLDKKSLTALWPTDGPDAGVTAANRITVSSSGPWTAKIYNTSEDELNPGFRFSNGLDTLAGNDAGTIEIISTGPNPSNSVRQGFVMVTLGADKKYRQVRVMNQEAMGTIEITPVYPSTPGLTFDAGGFAKLVDNGATQTFYRIDVGSGKNESGKLKAWEASLSGAHANYFTLTKVVEEEASYVILSAKGQVGTTPGNAASPGFNFGALLDQATLTIKLAGADGSTPGSVIELPIRQEPLLFGFTRISGLSVVPTTGAMVRTKVWTDDVKRDDYTMRLDGYRNFVEYRIDLPASLRWKAEIVGQSLPATAAMGTVLSPAYRKHEGYLIDNEGNKVNGTSIIGRTPENTVRVGFDMIYYPLFHWSDTPGSPENNRPQVTIRVTALDEQGNEIDLPGDDVTIITSQAPLEAKNLEIINTTNNTTGPGGYGGINTGGQNIVWDIREVLMNTTYFGTESNYVKTATNPANSLIHSRIDTWDANPTVVFRKTRNFINAASHNLTWNDKAYERTEDWRRDPETQGIVYFTGLDDAYTALNPKPFTCQYSTLYKLGWEENPSHIDPTDNITLSTANGAADAPRVMKYIRNGPFGTVTMNSTTAVIDGYHGSVKKSSMGPNAVSLLDDPSIAGGGYSLTGIDPVARVAYLGEVQIFENNFDDNDDENHFVGNYIAIFINAAQYGEHFLELLKDDCPEPLYLPNGTLVDPAP
jgi:hypothetical protein